LKGALVTMTRQTAQSAKRVFSRSWTKVRSVGLRPTRQRLALAKLLFDGEKDRHVTAEQLFGEATTAGARMSLATVYNTLHQFTEAGLLQQVTLGAGRLYFDTNTNRHHHLINAATGSIIDIEANEIDFNRLPRIPDGVMIDSIEVVIRVREPGQGGLAGNDND
jgi:Fur family transcriptional regulator, iron response regulator